MLDRLSSRYRDAVQNARWPKAALVGSTKTALVAAPTTSRSDQPDALVEALSKLPRNDILALISRADSSPSNNIRRCFNPNCRSTTHVARDCPVSWPKDYDHSRHGASRGRSRDSSRGRSFDRSRGCSRDHSALITNAVSPVTIGLPVL